MSASMDAEVERLRAALTRRGSISDPAVTYSRSAHPPNTKKSYEAKVSDIANKINETGKGHRETMYRGAAECAVMGHQIASDMNLVSCLFEGRLQKHWERKKKNASAIYHFLIQSAFEEPKQASKVFTATRAMFERRTSSEKFVERLRKYGGFDGLRKIDVVRGAQTKSTESSEGEDTSGRDDNAASVAGTGGQRLAAADIDPRHPKITALYSRMFRSKIELLALDDELKIKAVVWEVNRNRPVIRITSIEQISSARTTQKSE